MSTTNHDIRYMKKEYYCSKDCDCECMNCKENLLTIAWEKEQSAPTIDPQEAIRQLYGKE